MKKGGRVFSQTKPSRWHADPIILAALLFIFCILTASEPSMIGAVVSSPDIDFSYVGPQQIVFSESLTMDLSQYFTKSNLTYLTTDSELADIQLSDSLLSITSENQLEEFTLNVIGSDGIDVLSVPVTFKLDNTVEPTPLATPFDQTTFSFQDQFGVALSEPIIESSSRTVSYSHQPLSNVGVESSLVLAGVTPFSSSQITTVGAVTDDIIVTEVFVINDMSFVQAEYSLVKSAEVTTIFSCTDFDSITYTCNQWNPTTIEFTQDENQVFFTTSVNGIYAGGFQQTLPILSAQTQQATSKPAFKIEQEVESKLETESEVRVIVMMNEPQEPAPSGFSAQATSKVDTFHQRRQAISDKASTVLGRLQVGEWKPQGFAAQSGQVDFRVNHISKTIPMFSGKVTEQGLEKLRQDPDVKQVFIDRTVSLSTDASVALSNADFIKNISLQGVKLNGTGVSVCVIDSGTDESHRDFSFRILNHSCSCSTSDNGNGGCCLPTNTSTSNSSEDDYGHGTLAAGIILGGNNTFLGVAPGAGLVSKRAFNASGDASFSDVSAVMDDCIANLTTYNISVISMSFGTNVIGSGVFDASSGGFDNADVCDNLSSSVGFFTSQMNIAAGLGIITVAATGNNGFSTGISYPACVSNATAVASTTDSFAISSFSNRGNLTDVYAQGTSVCAARADNGTDLRGNAATTCDSPENQYVRASGTSFSTPHVAGAIAILDQARRLSGKPALTIQQVREVLNSTDRFITSGSVVRPFLNVNSMLSTYLSGFSINDSAGTVITQDVGLINFSTNPNDYTNAAECINISPNFIGVNDSGNCAVFNQSARITFFNVSRSNPVVFRNGVSCPASICTGLVIEADTVSVNVSSFSNFTVNESINYSDVILNSSLGTNMTEENLTVFFINASTNASLKNITNWYVNGSSTTVINYPFEGGSSAGVTASNGTTRDYSINDNTGVVVNTTFRPTGGQDGFGAYEFDGVNDYISIPTITYGPTMSFTAWVKQNSTNGFQNVFGVCDDPNNACGGGDYELLQFSIQNDGSIFFEFGPVNRGTRRTSSTTTSTGLFTVGEWTHVAGVVDTAANTADIYVNGIQQAVTTNNAGSGAGTITNELFIGSLREDFAANHQQYFNGSIDEFMIWNRTLSADQIRILATNKSGVLSFNETRFNETWFVNATPNDGIQDGVSLLSNSITLLDTNQPPSIEGLFLNSSNAGNTSDENLTVFINTSDVDGDRIKNITNWFVNDSSLAVVNLPFEANGGNEATFSRDYSPNQNNATPSASLPTFSNTSGVDGFGAYVFDGDDAFNISFNPSINVTDNFTIELFVRRDASGGERFVIARHDSWRLRWTTAGPDIQFLREDTLESMTFNVGTGDYSHIAIVINSTNMTMYVNGTLANVSASTGELAQSNNSIVLGSQQSQNNFFVGAIDELRIWNRTLTADQILLNYQLLTNTISSSETNIGDIWSVNVTPNDGVQDGISALSNNLTILDDTNQPPTISAVILNSSNATNTTDENLSFTIVNANDAESDPIKNISNWYQNNRSFAVLNLPFEGGSTSGVDNVLGSTKDYSGFGVGTDVFNVTFNSTGGHDGFGGYEFNGFDDHINLTGNLDHLSFNETDFTITAWFKTTGNVGAFNDAIYSDAGNPSNNFIVLGIDIDNRLRFLVRDENLNIIVINGTGPLVNDDSWHHVAAIRNSNNLTLYLDGIFVNSSISTLGSVNTSGGRPVRIGKQTGTSTTVTNWNGSIDDLMVYNRALSTEQIQILANRSQQISSTQTAINDVWFVNITPNDGTQDGSFVLSNNLTILPGDLTPSIDSVILNTSNATNTSSENLTSLIVGAFEPSGVGLKNITRWVVNEESLLLLHVPFEANTTSGTQAENGIVIDYSGANRDGVGYNTTHLPRSGFDTFGAIFANGTSSYVDFGDLNEIETEGSRTVTLWFNSTTAKTQALVTKFQDNTPEDGWSVSVFEDAKIEAAFKSDSAGVRVNSSPNTILDGQFHHVALSWNSNDNFHLYLDGNEVANGSMPSGSYSGNSRPVLIGARLDQTTTPFAVANATIDDVQIWNRQLSIDQIQILANRNYNEFVTNETRNGQVWQVCITPTNAASVGLEVCSNNITLSDPLQGGVIVLNSTQNQNTSTENLTATNPIDNVNAVNFTEWYKNSQSQLLLMMPFDGGALGSGSTVRDYSSQGNNGTIETPGTVIYNPTAGINGRGAYEFGGNEASRISFNEIRLPGDTNWTISVWIKPNTTTINRGLIGEGEAFDNAIQIGVTSIEFKEDGNLGANIIARQAHGNDWAHYGFVANGNDTLKLYFNGSLIAVLDQPTEFLVDNIGHGVTLGTTTHTFEGVIDELFIWNTSLTQSQINLVKDLDYQTLHESMTLQGDIWRASVTPNDNTQDASTNLSNEILIGSGDIFGLSNSGLNSSSGSNSSTENLSINFSYNANSISGIPNFAINSTGLIVGHYPFDSEESPYKDYSPNNNHGIPIGNTSFIAGASVDGDGVASFAEDNKGVSIRPITFEEEDEWSISFWVKKSNTADMAVIGEDAGFDNMILIGNTDIEYREDSDTSTSTIANFGALGTNWNHFTIVAKGTKTVLAYLNGTLLGGLDADSDFVINTLGHAVQQGQSTASFSGQLDDIVIWNTSLTDSQINLIFNNQQHILSSALLQPQDTVNVSLIPTNSFSDGQQIVFSDYMVEEGDSYGLLASALNTSEGLNSSLENLTASINYSENVNLIRNWNINGSSLTILHLPFDTEQNPFKDYSGQENDLNISELVFYNSSNNIDTSGSVYFNGTTNDFASLNRINLSNESAWSISFYAQPATTPVFNIIAGEAQTTTNLIALSSSGLDFRDPGTTASNIVASFTPGTQNTYYTLVAPGNGSLFTYINGSFFSSVLNNTDLIIDAIGDGNLGTDVNFEGYLDEFIIWNTSLTSEQIGFLYNNQSELLSSTMTTAGDTWQQCVTPTDGLSDGALQCTNNLTLETQSNEAPAISNVILNSTTGANTSNENLTAFIINASDADGDSIKNITDWKVNGSSIAVLNMPFEAHDGDESVVAKDYSSFGNNGTVNGAFWNQTGGHDGFASYRFDGNDDDITVSDSTSLNISDALTIEAWIQVDDAGTNVDPNQYIVMKGDGGFNDPADNSYSIYVANLGSSGTGSQDCVLFELSNGTDRIRDNAVGHGLCLDAITATEWVHVVGTWDGSVMRTYKNGQQISSLDVNFSGPLNVVESDLYIGRLGDGTRHFDGSISELRIYDRALSSNQITEIYNASVQNATLTTIVSDETVVNEVWAVQVTPNDGTQDGVSVSSNNVTILSSPAQISQIILNSTFGTNLSSENLTAFIINASDLDADDIKNITNWYVNATSLSVLNMPFEGGSNGTATRDYSAFSNDGSVSGPTFFSSLGHDGFGAYSFDGVDDQITITDDASLDAGSGSSTFAAWVNISSTSGVEFAIVHGVAGAATLRTLGVASGGTVDARIEDSTATQVTSTADGANVLGSGWNHIAVVFDRESNQMIRYVNGTQTGTVDSLAGLSGNTDSTEPVRIGALPSAAVADRFFGGLIDDVYITNRALSAEQIRFLASTQTNNIASNETGIGDTWFVNVTPNDGTQDGISVLSNNLTILDASTNPPIIAQVILNSTFHTNSTIESLTAFLINVSDADANNIKNITSFMINDTSWAVFNTPFETTGEQNILVRDYSSNAFNGTINNATYNSTAGYDGFGAYQFDGQGDFINFTNTTDLNFGTQDFTVSGWVSSDTVGSLHTMIAKTDNIFSSTEPGWHLSIAGVPNTLGFDIQNGSNRQFVSFDLGGPFSMSFVTAVKENDTIKTYTNGTLRNTVTSPAFTNYNLDNNASITIGRGIQVTTPRDWDGTIDDIKIYPRALSQEQITNLYLNNLQVAPNETAVGDSWSVNVTPNDGTQDGVSVLSNNVTIVATDIVVLNSTSEQNFSNQNLTLTINTVRPDVTNITSWFVNNSPYFKAYYPFEAGDDNSTANDFSGHGRDGTVNNPTYNNSGGHDGFGRYIFDGASGNQIVLPATLNVAFEEQTLALWVRADGSSDSGTIGSMYDNSFFGGSCGSSIGCGNDQCTNVSANIYTGTTTFVGANIENGQWFHVVQTYDGSNQRLYLNGSLVSSNTNTGAITRCSGGTPEIGGDQGGTGFTFNGSISEVIVLNKSLSADQVYSLFAHKHTIIDDAQLIANDTWTASVTISNRSSQLLNILSNNVTIQQAPQPLEVNGTVLNSTFGTNFTTENLTVFIVNTSMSTSIANITTFYLNGTSAQILNMPFEANLTANGGTRVRDYAQNNNGLPTGTATFLPSGGYDGNGAFEFDGLDDGLTINPIGFTRDQRWSVSFYAQKDIDDNGGTILAESGTSNNFIRVGPSTVLFRDESGTTVNFNFDDNLDMHFYTLVFDQDIGRLYVDGEFVDQQPPQSPGFAATFNSIADGGAATGDMDGIIDELIVWNTTLTPTQVSFLFNNNSANLASSFTNLNDTWVAQITPNDGTQDGSSLNSTSLTIVEGDSYGFISNALNSSIGVNATTNNNLSGNVNYSSDILLINSLYVNGSPLSILYLPFATEANPVLDYSGTNRKISRFSDAYHNASKGINGALQLDGVDDGVFLRDPINFTNASRWSITFYMQKDIDDNGGSILGFNSTTANVLRVGPDEVFFRASHGNDVEIPYDDALNFTFYAIVFNQTNMSLYVDGQLFGSVGFHPFGSEVLFNTVGYDGTPTGDTDGIIDEVIIWNRSLEAEQILALYNNQTNLITSSLTAPSETWQICTIPTDLLADGVQTCSNNVTIQALEAAVGTNVVLNSTNNTNTSTENLTYVVTNFTELSGSVKNITRWIEDGQFIQSLIMPFDGNLLANGSTNVRDYSINENNGTNIAGATYNSTGGHDGRGAFEFDGSFDRIGFTQIPYTSSEPWTLSFYAKPFAVNTREVIADNGGNSRITFNSDTLMEIRQSSNFATTFSIPPALNNYNFYTIVAQPTNQLIVYVNGSLVGEADIGSGINFNFAGIGSGNGAASDFFGQIDDVTLWNVTLTPSQVKALFENKLDIISSSETNLGQVWSAQVTPNNNVADGQTTQSNNVTIVQGDTFGFVQANASATNILNSTLENVSFDANYSVPTNTVFSPAINGTQLMLLHYPFDVEQNPTYDFSGENNHGNQTSTFWNATGGFDGSGAIEFDGTNDAVIFPRIDFDTRSQWSSSFWVKKDTGGSVVIANNFGNAKFEFVSGSLFAIRDSGNFQITMSIPNIDHTYHHIAVTKDQGDTFRVYLNGSFVGEGDLDNDLQFNQLGGGASGSDFTGTLDEVIFWNRTLSAQQIELIFNNQLTTLHSAETFPNDTINTNVTPHDSIAIGQMQSSAAVTLQEDDFENTSAILNSTLTMNTTDENLTAFFSFNETNKSITSWYRNSSPVMIAYWPFDVAQNPQRDFSGNNNELNLTEEAFWNETSGYDQAGAFDFDGSGDRLEFNRVTFAGTDQWAVSFWTKKQSGTSHEILTSSGSSRISLQTDTAIEVRDSSNFAISATVPNLQSNFNHVVITKNGSTNYLIYTNATLRGGGSLSNSVILNRLGGGGVGSDFDGTIDELTIWNMSLSQDQIQTLFESEINVLVSNQTMPGETWQACAVPHDNVIAGTQVCTNNLTIQGSIPDSTPPSVINLSPANASTFPIESIIEIGANITDSSGVNVTTANITLPNGSIVQLTLTRALGDIYNTSFTVPLQLGTYSVIFFANDTNNNINSSEITSFNAIDILTPNVTDTTPTSGSVFNVSQTIQIGANITDQINVSNVSINITLPNGTILNQIVITNGQFYNTSFTIPALIGTYTVNFFANDSSNNINSSESTFFVGNDTILPNVTDIIPINDSSFNEGVPVQIGANVTDNVAVSTVRVNITLPNGTITQTTLSLASANFYNVSFTPPTPGTYTIRIIANDTTNNINNTVFVTFSVIPTPLNPVLTITKTDIQDPLSASSTQINYTLTISNTGPGNATNVTVTENYPSNTSFNTSTPPASGTNNTFDIGNITAGSSTTINISLNIDVNLTQDITFTNNVNVTYLNASNETLIATASETTTFSVPAPSSGGGGGSGGGGIGTPRSVVSDELLPLPQIVPPEIEARSEPVTPPEESDDTPEIVEEEKEEPKPPIIESPMPTEPPLVAQEISKMQIPWWLIFILIGATILSYGMSRQYNEFHTNPKPFKQSWKKLKQPPSRPRPSKPLRIRVKEAPVAIVSKIKHSREETRIQKQKDHQRARRLSSVEANKKAIEEHKSQKDSIVSTILALRALQKDSAKTPKIEKKSPIKPVSKPKKKSKSFFASIFTQKKKPKLIKQTRKTQEDFIKRAKQRKLEAEKPKVEKKKIKQVKKKTSPSPIIVALKKYQKDWQKTRRQKEKIREEQRALRQKQRDAQIRKQQRALAKAQKEQERLDKIKAKEIQKQINKNKVKGRIKKPKLKEEPLTLPDHEQEDSTFLFRKKEKSIKKRKKISKESTELLDALKSLQDDFEE